MKQHWLPRILFWVPRSLGIFFALFVSIFALDVFGQGYGVWGTIVALYMHLIPVYVLLLALVIAWRWEWGGVALCGLWHLVLSNIMGAVSARLHSGRSRGRAGFGTE